MEDEHKTQRRHVPLFQFQFSPSVIKIDVTKISNLVTALRQLSKYLLTVVHWRDFSDACLENKRLGGTRGVFERQFRVVVEFQRRCLSLAMPLIRAKDCRLKDDFLERRDSKMEKSKLQ